MTISVYNKGDLVRVTAAFEDISGTPVDPTTVSLKTLDPSGNVDEYTYAGGAVTKASTGNYYKDVDADEEGDWHCWWEATGSGEGAEPVQFVVAPTPF